MNPAFFGIIIFVLVFLFLYWFVNTSSKKIAYFLKRLAIFISLILAMIFLHKRKNGKLGGDPSPLTVLDERN